MGAGTDKTEKPQRNRSSGGAGQARPNRIRFAGVVLQEASLLVQRLTGFYSDLIGNEKRPANFPARFCQFPVPHLGQWLSQKTHMELQAIRYASMVSTMTFDHAVDVFGRYLQQIDKQVADPKTEILDFLGWDEPDEDQFARDVKIVLASAEFSRELTTSVLWLVNREIDIRCVRLQPYEFDGRVLVDAQQIIPLPEATEYQIQVREKARKEREARSSGADYRTPPPPCRMTGGYQPTQS